MTKDSLETKWNLLRAQARQIAQQEPLLAPWLEPAIKVNAAKGIALILARKLATHRVSSRVLVDNLAPIYRHNQRVEIADSIPTSASFSPAGIREALFADLQVASSEATDRQLLNVLLFSKSYQAICCYRAAHWLWHQGRQSLASYLQSRVSKVFAIDIHPAATIGKGVLIDQGSGLVIGATAVVEDYVSIMQQVTLGGTGKELQDRHPKIRSHVFIGAGAQILGNIEVGKEAVIAPASVVLSPVKANTYVAGVPAKVSSPDPD